MSDSSKNFAIAQLSDALNYILCKRALQETLYAILCTFLLKHTLPRIVKYFHHLV